MYNNPSTYRFHILYKRGDIGEPARDFAEYTCNELEKIPSLQPGYMIDRDALPPLDIFDEFDRVVRASRYTICVIDTTFLKSGFTRYKEKLAFMDSFEEEAGEGRSFIILALGIERTRIKEECKNLRVEEMLEVALDTYRDETNWLEKLKMILQNGMSVPRNELLSHPIKETTRAPTSPVSRSTPVEHDMQEDCEQSVNDTIDPARGLSNREMDIRSNSEALEANLVADPNQTSPKDVESEDEKVYQSSLEEATRGNPEGTCMTADQMTQPKKVQGEISSPKLVPQSSVKGINSFNQKGGDAINSEALEANLAADPNQTSPEGAESDCAIYTRDEKVHQDESSVKEATRGNPDGITADETTEPKKYSTEQVQAEITSPKLLPQSSVNGINSFNQKGGDAINSGGYQIFHDNRLRFWGLAATCLVIFFTWRKYKQL